MVFYILQNVKCIIGLSAKRQPNGFAADDDR